MINWDAAITPILTALLTAGATAALTYSVQAKLRKKDQDYALRVSTEEAAKRESRALLDIADHLERFVIDSNNSLTQLYQGFQEYHETNGASGFENFRSLKFTMPERLLLDAIPLVDVDELRKLSKDYDQQGEWIHEQAEWCSVLDAYEYDEERILLFGVLAWKLRNRYRQRCGLDASPSLSFLRLNDFLEKYAPKVAEAPDCHIPAMKLYFNVVSNTSDNNVT